MNALNLPPIGFGGMPLSIQGRPDEEQGRRVLRAAVDAGMTFVDTADVYCLDDNDIGHNERLIASALGAPATLVSPRADSFTTPIRAPSAAVIWAPSTKG